MLQPSHCTHSVVYRNFQPGFFYHERGLTCEICENYKNTEICPHWYFYGVDKTVDVTITRGLVDMMSLPCTCTFLVFWIVLKSSIVLPTLHDEEYEMNCCSVMSIRTYLASE